MLFLQKHKTGIYFSADPIRKSQGGFQARPPEKNKPESDPSKKEINSRLFVVA